MIAKNNSGKIYSLALIPLEFINNIATVDPYLELIKSLNITFARTMLLMAIWIIYWYLKSDKFHS